MRANRLPGPTGLDKQTNHGGLWVTALLVAAVITGIAYGLFASFEHDSWFPRELARFLNDNEVLVFAGGGAVLMFLAAMFLYARGTFTRKAEAGDGWASGLAPGATAPRTPGFGAAIPAARPRPAGAPASFGKKQSEWPRIPVVLRNKRRACQGDLVLTDRRFFFICYRDESLTRSVGGKAVAQQFGLLGALVHALVSGSGRKRKARSREEARQAVAGLSLEAQAEQSEFSLRLAPQDITLFAHSGVQGTRFEARGEKYGFIDILKADFPAIKAWCDGHGVPTRGL